MKGVSREGNSTGLYSVEGSSDDESFDLFADKSEDSVSSVSEDDSTFSTFVQQEDLHLLQESPFFLQEHLMLEHFDFRLQLQQPTKFRFSFFGCW